MNINLDLLQKGIQQKMNYKGNKYTFAQGSYISQGGNGIVYNVKNIQCINSTIKLPNSNCVVKVLKKKLNNKSNERYQRFILEIDKVSKLQKNIHNIMKILDYNKGNNSHSNPWFLMYKAKSFAEEYKNHPFTARETINYMITISDVLIKLHQYTPQMAHRDIKMSNILFLNKKIYLSDFGLVWTNDNQNDLTNITEKLGPTFIGPPELESIYLKNQNIDYCKSDVYLFAKLIWACLKNDSFCFRGKYIRNSDYYLHSDKLKVYSLEPIHRLLEDATNNDMTKRITIKKCKQLLQEELKIIDKISGNYYTYKNKETILEIINRQNADTISFKEPKKILNILQKLIFSNVFYIKGYDNVFYINNIKIYGDKYLELDDNENLYLCYPTVLNINGISNIELHIQGIDAVDDSEYIAYFRSENGNWKLPTSNDQKFFFNKNCKLFIRAKKILLENNNRSHYV